MQCCLCVYFYTNMTELCFSKLIYLASYHLSPTVPKISCRVESIEQAGQEVEMTVGADTAATAHPVLPVAGGGARLRYRRSMLHGWILNNVAGCHGLSGKNRLL